VPPQSAPFFRRLAARLIDLVLALVATFVIGIPVGVVCALASGLLGEGLWLTLLVYDWSGSMPSTNSAHRS